MMLFLIVDVFLFLWSISEFYWCYCVIFPLFNLLEMMVLIICTSRICILNNPKDLTYSKRFVVHCHCSILLLYNVVINNGNIHYLAIKYKTDTYLKMLKLKILRLILAQEWGVDTFLESIPSFIWHFISWRWI